MYVRGGGDIIGRGRQHDLREKISLPLSFPLVCAGKTTKGCAYSYTVTVFCGVRQNERQKRNRQKYLCQRWRPARLDPLERRPLGHMHRWHRVLSAKLAIGLDKWLVKTTRISVSLDCDDDALTMNCCSGNGDLRDNIGLETDNNMAVSKTARYIERTNNENMKPEHGSANV